MKIKVKVSQTVQLQPYSPYNIELETELDVPESKYKQELINKQNILDNMITDMMLKKLED